MKKQKDPLTYNSWRGIRDRCLNPKSKGYLMYGARGISVVSRWESYDLFVEDMGLRPSKEHSLDRIDNNGGYSKENCRWATKKEQALNRRSNHKLTFEGKTLSVSEWEEEKGFPKGCLSQRVNDGWTTEDALTTPPRPITWIAYQGRLQTLSAWEKEFGLGQKTLKRRLSMGMPFEAAISKKRIS